MTKSLQILRNLEYGFSLLTVGGALVWLAVQSVTRSRDYYRRIEQFEPIIRKGWVPFSYGVDLTDRQWRTWRESAPILVPFMLLCIFISRKISGSARLWYYAVWGLLFCVILHGNGILWLIIVMTVNFSMIKILGSSRLSPVWTWCSSLSLLYTTKICEEDDWRSQLEALGLSCPGKTPFTSIFGSSLTFLDNYKGLYEWSSPLNMLILRIISFNIEYWRAQRLCHERNREKESTPTVEDKNTTVCNPEFIPSSGFLHLWGYAFYPPLYVAGPIVTYDSFLSQTHTPASTRTANTNTTTSLRALATASLYAVCLDVTLHFIYYHAISHNLPVIFHQFSKSTFFIPPWEIMLIGFFVLNFMYVKFLVIWRTSRALAALDGVAAADNMPRCVCNNHTFAGFWRAWHASLHAWIIRYVYLPLGGRHTQYLTVWPIFLFIGVWHDWELRWVCWALSNACCLIAERALLARAATAPALAPLRSRPRLWRYVCAAAAVGNIYLLMLCNLSILYGYQGSADFIRAFVAPPRPWAGGWDVVCANAVAVWWLLCGVLIMFRLREDASAAAAGGACPAAGRVKAE